jgi:linearmycin/streptolysin S transport system permease protein
VTDWLSTAAATAGLELRRWVREPIAVLSTLVLPLIMAALISVALGGDLGAYSTTFAVVDQDGGVAADQFTERVLGDPQVREVVRARAVRTVDEAVALLDDGDVGAAVVLPEGLSARLAEGAAPSRPGEAISVLPDPDDPVAGDLAALLVDQFEVRARAVTLVQRQTGAAPDRAWPLEVTVGSPGGTALDAATHYGPALGLFFVMVTMGFAAARLVGDRQRGVVERLAAGPASPAAVVTGRALAAVALGGLSLATLAVAMGVLFGAWWGPAVPVLVVTAALVLALGGVAAVLAAVARTPEQAQSLSLGVAFLFALASGSFAPPGTVLRPAFAAAPTTHALDAFARLSTQHAGVGAVAPQVAALCLFGLAGLVLTAAITRRLA